MKLSKSVLPMIGLVTSVVEVLKGGSPGLNGHRRLMFKAAMSSNPHQILDGCSVTFVGC